MAVALKSCFEPLVCLQWVTDRLYIDDKPIQIRPTRCRSSYTNPSRRESPQFGLLRNKWYLQMTLENCYSQSGKETHCEIKLHNLRTSSTPSYDSLTVDCHLNIGFSRYDSDRSFVRGNNNSIVIFNKPIYEEDVRPSVSVKEWKVICMFSGNIPNEMPPCQFFSLQIGSKVVHMAIDDKDELTESFDECTVVSRKVRRDMEALSTDLSGLLEEGILPDFQLQCQDQVFKVHRSVLAARSEVFRAMLRSGMKESETGSADLKDLEAPVLQILLKYLYSGKLGDLSEDTVFKLYEVSDKYAVRSLFTTCSCWLIRNMTVDNCVNYLSTSDSHSDPDLKEAAVSSRSIIAHPGVFKSTAWSTFLKERLALASEVLQAYATASSQ